MITCTVYENVEVECVYILQPRESGEILVFYADEILVVGSGHSLSLWV